MASDSNLKKTAAIVLGGGLRKVKGQNQVRYQPEEQVEKRLDRAYELFKEGRVDYIVTTGKYSKRVGIDPNVVGPKTEAEVGREYLIARFKSDEVDNSPHTRRSIEDYLLYENQSFDTIGNAWFAKKICLEPFGITSCIIITSDYHMERSKIIFEWVLGPQYAIECMEIPSQLNDAEREQRDRLETVFIDYVNMHLLGSIAPGDDEEIRRFMRNEHLRYCLSERSEALLNAFMATATIKAGYKKIPAGYPVPFVLIKMDYVLQDGKVAGLPNKLRIPGNNGRKILATSVMPKFGEKEIEDSIWKVPSVLPTGDGGIEVATFTEYSGQDRHKHGKGVEIYTVLKGSMQIYVNDEGPYTLHQSEEIVILPGTVHEVVQKKPDPAEGTDDFGLVVRVHSINCFGEADKYVQLEQGGEWKLWKDLREDQRQRAIKKQSIT